jgi:hypothetical protein
MGSKEEVVGVKARSVLWYLTFIGFAMNYMIRININIAIVDMISSEYKSKSKGVFMSECSNGTNLNNSTLYDIKSVDFALRNEQQIVAKDYVSLERQFLDYLGVS